jgi:hypothetical protein
MLRLIGMPAIVVAPIVSAAMPGPPDRDAKQQGDDPIQARHQRRERRAPVREERQRELDDDARDKQSYDTLPVQAIGSAGRGHLTQRNSKVEPA